MELTKLSNNLSVTPQIHVDEIADVAAAGFTGIVNNRPDDEAADQPASRDLEAEARRLGLSYWHIPVVPGQATRTDAARFAAALREAGGPVVAFCRTGARSTALWKMTQQGR